MGEVIVPAADVLRAAMLTAVRLAQLAPQAVQGTKMAVNRLLAMASGAVLPLSWRWRPPRWSATTSAPPWKNWARNWVANDSASVGTL
jgi:TRAP-type C4-dicarboxylate transport system permease small subunit